MTNIIHPTVIIEGDVELGAGNHIDAFSILRGPLRIGDNNRIGPSVFIGSPSADRKADHSSRSGLVTIGSNNIIREFTSIQEPTKTGSTTVGDNCYIMQCVHLAHDATIADDVTITANVALGGTCWIGRGANLGMNAAVHQNSVIGAFAMIAAGAPVVKNVPPFAKLIPGRELGFNIHGLRVAGLAEFDGEAMHYLATGTMPHSTELREFVDAFEAAHTASGRGRHE